MKTIAMRQAASVGVVFGMLLQLLHRAACTHGLQFMPQEPSNCLPCAVHGAHNFPYLDHYFFV